MLVTTDELGARLPFAMDADELREATGALEDLSFDAQALGNAAWATPEATPQSVKNLILRAAARHMKNYEGYTVSRAGDETVQWSDKGESAGTATFTDDEKRLLRTMGGKTPFIGGVTIVAHGTAQRKIGYVPVDYAPTLRRSDFPLYADEVEPW